MDPPCRSRFRTLKYFILYVHEIAGYMHMKRVSSSYRWLKTTKADDGNFNEGLGYSMARKRMRTEGREKSTNSCLALKLPLLFAGGEDFTNFCSWYRNNGRVARRYIPDSV